MNAISRPKKDAAFIEKAIEKSQEIDKKKEELASSDFAYKNSGDFLKESKLTKDARRRTEREFLNIKIASTLADDLAASLGTVSALAANLNDGDKNIAAKISIETSKVFRNLISKNLINLDSISLESTPHTCAFVSALKKRAEYKTLLAANEITEDPELLSETSHVISEYEGHLCDTVNIKMKFMLEEEKKLQQKIEEDQRIANESMFPEKFMERKAKEHSSFFRNIMNIHTTAALKEDANPSKENIFSEALITYNILETLHTSRLASKADLSWIGL
jgi:hypothetical protein